MARQSKILTVTALSLALVAMLGADAQALVRHPHHRLVRGGEVVVHTGRSYLDPGTSAAVGSENHYFSDTAPYSFSGLGAPFTGATAGFELLPSRFNPPGRAEPLFQF
ncbi:MAG: hypothetical protein ABSE69_10615 [Roseiarcus sp.]|jgi:hypothetical protein